METMTEQQRQKYKKYFDTSANKKDDKKKDQKEGGFMPVKGMVSPRKRRVHTDQPSKETIDKTSEAAMKDWRSKGISNNQIKDY